MKKIFLVLSCILLTSCGKLISDDMVCEIRYRILNDDNTYHYSYRAHDKLSVMKGLDTSKKFNVGDTFTISLNRVDNVDEKTNTKN